MTDPSLSSDKKLDMDTPHLSDKKLDMDTPSDLHSSLSSDKRSGTSEKHLRVRTAADELYKRNAERMQVKYCKGKRKKVTTFSVGNVVSIKVPRIDRMSTDLHRVICVVVECRGEEHHLYRLRCEHGVLRACFGEGGLELYCGTISLSTDNWENDTVLSLHEAARLANPLNEFHGGTCKCKSKCTTNKCPCTKKGAPCSSKCHGGQKCSNNSQPPKCQSTESTTDSSKWLPTLHLDIHDKEVCESGVWLTDNHMLAAQNLLWKQFPHVQGLQPTVYDQGSKWTPMTSGGVQLLNQSSTLWLCVSMIECSPGEVALYDSLLSKTKVHPQIIKQIATIRNTKETHLTIKIMHSQGQTGTNDCGLFAIATATLMCYNIPPSTVLWDQEKMRQHLITCFENGKMEPFPAWDLPQQQKVISSIGEEQVLEEVKVRVYCRCRMPQTGRVKMAQCTKCNEWYHQNCENIPQTVFCRKNRMSFVCAYCQ